MRIPFRLQHRQAPVQGEDGGRGSRCGGFSLLEVLISTALLAVGSLVAFPTILSFFDLSQSSRDDNIATHDLRSAVEDVLATPFSVVETTYPDGQPIPKFDALHLRAQQITVNYENPGTDPLSIRVTATWQDHKGRPLQETFRCMKTR